MGLDCSSSSPIHSLASFIETEAVNMDIDSGFIGNREILKRKDDHPRGINATMQLPKESLKNIQAFYLLVWLSQNMKFIYSSLQRKSFPYISIIWLYKTIFRHRMSLTPI